MKKRGVKWPYELTEEDLNGKSKLNNTKVTLDGIKFDSKKEANFYAELKIRKAAGEIKSFIVKPEKFILQPSFKNREGKTIRAITYTADFKIEYPDGAIEYIDVKGFRTEKFDIKFKIFQYKFPELILRLV